MGRPKTAVIGGLLGSGSSQSLKRAWRTSDVFQQRVGVIGIDGDAGLRTKRFGQIVYERLVEGGIKEKSAMEWARAIAESASGRLKETESFLIISISSNWPFSPEERVQRSNGRDLNCSQSRTFR